MGLWLHVGYLQPAQDAWSGAGRRGATRLLCGLPSPRRADIAPKPGKPKPLPRRVRVDATHGGCSTGIVRSNQERV